MGLSNVETNFSRIQKLQSFLCSISENDFNEIKEFIVNSNFLNTRESMLELLNSLNTMYTVRPALTDYYFKIIIMIKDKISLYFSSYELLNYIALNNFFRFKLYEVKLIDIQSIVFYLKNTADLNCFFLFAFEIHSLRPDIYSSFLCRSSDFRNDLKQISKEDHFHLRSKGLNQDKLAIFIREDNIEEFQNHVAQTNVSLNSKIKDSSYENRMFPKDKLSIIEYAALFGSLEVFKFLFSHVNFQGFENDDPYAVYISGDIIKYAVAGGNYDIIHLIEQFDPSSVTNNLDSLLLLAIECHRNDIVQYLKDNHDIEFQQESLIKSIRCNNIDILIDIINNSNCSQWIETLLKDEKNILLIEPIQNGFLNILHFFLSNIPQQCVNLSNLFFISIHSGQLDCLSFIYSLIQSNHIHISQDLDNQPVLGATQIAHLQMIKYLNHISTQNPDIDMKACDRMKNNALHLSVSYGNIEIVKYLVSLNIFDINGINNYGVLFIFEYF